jgi:hypothetical protein
MLGYPNPDFMGPQTPRASLNEGKLTTNDFECVVVGAGFGVLCLSGRLQAMNVRYVALESNTNVGITVGRGMNRRDVSTWKQLTKLELTGEQSILRGVAVTCRCQEPLPKMIHTF